MTDLTQQFFPVSTSTRKEYSITVQVISGQDFQNKNAYWVTNV